MKKIIKNKKNIYILLLIPIILICITNISLNNDIWFIFNHGRYVLEHGIPHIEPFTLHAGLEFVMQQWLSALIFWIVYKFLGKVGLFLFLIFFDYCLILVFYKLLKLMCNNKNLSIFLTLLFSFCIRVFLVSRPQVFTFFVLILEIYLLEKYIKFDKTKYLYFLPLLSLLEINLHASMWFFQFLFILPFILDGIKIKKIKIPNYRLKPLVIVTIFMFVIGFINPYGYRAVFYVFNSFGYSYINNYVFEMKPLIFNFILFKIILACIFALVFILNYFKSLKLDFRHLCLLFGTLILAFMNVRSVPYFFIIYFYIFSYLLKNIKLIRKFEISRNIRLFIQITSCGLILLSTFFL